MRVCVYFAHGHYVRHENVVKAGMTEDNKYIWFMMDTYLNKDIVRYNFDEIKQITIRGGAK